MFLIIFYCNCRLFWWSLKKITVVAKQTWMKNNEIICKQHEKILYESFKPALEEQLQDVIPAKMEMILENNTFVDFVTFIVITEQSINVLSRCNSGVRLNSKQRQRVTIDWWWYRLQFIINCQLMSNTTIGTQAKIRLWFRWLWRRPCNSFNMFIIL